jgi:predicted aspartyl protease
MPGEPAVREVRVRKEPATTGQASDSSRLSACLRGLALVASLLFPPGSVVLAQLPPPATPAEPVYAIPTRPDRAGRLLVPVQVDGRGPLRFLVDTGCNGTMIGLPLALSLGFTSDPAKGSGMMVKVHDVLGPVLMPAMRLDVLDIGRFTNANITAPIMMIGDRSGADGVIGTNSLVGRRLVVDFTRDRIRIEPSRRQPPIGFETIKGRMHGDNLLIVPVQIAGITVPALVDTGAERSLFNKPLLDRLQIDGRIEPLGYLQLVNLSGLEMSGPVHLLPRFRLGSLTIRNLAGVLVDAHAFDTLNLADQPAMVLGMDVLGITQGIAIDFGRGELHLRLDDRGNPRIVRQ